MARFSPMVRLAPERFDPLIQTFCMEGIRNIPELRGIIPNAFDHIFSYISHAGTAQQFLVRASYLEIYNEDIRDLLNINAKKLDIKERADTGVYVKDLSTFVVKDAQEIENLMNVGNKNRSVAFTQMNATSSRSHSIFTITVEASENIDGQEHLRAGKLHLVDLAGSERQAKTGASGDRLKEASKINLSLSALGNVISALVDGKSSHIPYRDSKLTRLLQDSLGGNAKTLMIATLSPASYNYEETNSTLRYANRAKNIKNKPKVNEDPKDAMLREFQEEIKRLKCQLESDGNDLHHSDAEQESENDKDEIHFSKRNSKKQSHGGISEAQLSMMQEMVLKEKTAILASKDMEESKRNQLLQEAEQRVQELEREREARKEVAEKLAQLEKKLLIGGVNIIDQHELQQMMLSKRALELEEQARKERELQQHLQEREEANLRIEEEFGNLQEEAQAKTKKLKKLWTIYSEQKSELKDLLEEQQREREALLETIRELSKDLKLKNTVISKYIPQNEQYLIEECAEYDTTSESWRILHLTHSGNNVKDKRSVSHKSDTNSLIHRDYLTDEPVWNPMCVFQDLYLSYEIAGLKKSVKASPKKTKLRAESAKEKPEKVLAPPAPIPQARGLIGTKKRFA
jgi:hypothetical protein